MQTFQDFEIINIDWQSKDTTANIIAAYKHFFWDRLKVFSYPPKGIWNAMNKGIDHSTGQYIMHLHSDDYLFNKHSLEIVKENIEKHNYPNWIYDNLFGLKIKLISFSPTLFGIQGIITLSYHCWIISLIKQLFSKKKYFKNMENLMKNLKYLWIMNSWWESENMKNEYLSNIHLITLGGILTALHRHLKIRYLSY